MLRFLRTRNHHLAEQLAELRRLELDAAEACRRAVDVLPPDEPLTRGQLLSYLSEHELHAATLATMLTKLPPPRGVAVSAVAAGPHVFEGRRGSTSILRVIRRNAELGVRKYQDVLDEVPHDFVTVVRAHTNAWLRHRAWLTARIDAFSRTRDSHPTPH